MSALHSNLPVSAGFLAVNRACASGLQAVVGIAEGVMLGRIRGVGLAGGVESMARFYGNKAIPWEIWPELLTSDIQGARHGVMQMGMTSENVASRYGVSREKQDEFSLQSHKLAHEAQQRGDFENDIIPVTCEYVPPARKDSDALLEKQQITVTRDDGVRPGTTIEKLASLPPVFSPTGSSTAGNSSQISDGAAAMLIMSRARAEALGLTPLGRFIASAVLGCPPDEMGIGPALAIPKLLEFTGVQREQVDVWEINEAFASQAIYCIRELGLEKELEEGERRGGDMGVVNPNGGAIALGHPLGATGARLVVGLLGELERRKIKGQGVRGEGGQGVGVVSMCIGGGQGMAAMFVGE